MEFVRHRVFSFAQESQRYCNYSANKHNNQVTYCIPCWSDIPNEVVGINNIDCWSIRNGEPFDHIGDICKGIDFHIAKPTYIFLQSLKECERNYFYLLQGKWKPQEARAVLPNACKTELVMTGFISDWKHFFDLRCPANAHPSAQELANPLKEEFIKRGYIDK